MEPIQPKDIIEKYTPEEICEGAEAYYFSMKSDSTILQKPLRTVQEAAECFEGLGILLRNLQVAAGMKVLDFGSGMCWISNYLAQAGCRVTACDPSHTALALGKKVIDRNPWIENDAVQYLVFNGRKIEVPNESFDRIVCFDVLHHLPNWVEVLGEMYRVLKPGGMIGFREPGYGHSQCPPSQYEMRHYVVLENDIRIDEIVEEAIRIGFDFDGWEPATRRKFSLRDYVSEFSGLFGFWRRCRTRRNLYRDAREYMKSSSNFFLRKGDLMLDSRVGRGLEARLRVKKTELSIDSGIAYSLDVEVFNTGRSLWLGVSESGFGQVFLGSHLLNAEGEPIHLDLVRAAIGRDLRSGDSRTITLPLPPLEKGRYLLDLDMVSEGVNWFEMAQSASSEKARICIDVV